MNGRKFWEDMSATLKVPASGLAITAEDYFLQGRYCGFNLLADKQTGNFFSVRGEKLCKKDVWSSLVAKSSINSDSFTVVAERKLQQTDMSTVWLTGKIYFRTGFNIFDSAVDDVSEASGSSEEIEWVYVLGSATWLTISCAGASLLAALF